MHPPLSIHKHPHCAEKCHKDHPFAKFFGKCTELKYKLDRCFREEKRMKQKANFEKSKRFKEEFFATNAAVRARLQKSREERAY